MKTKTMFGHHVLLKGLLGGRSLCDPIRYLFNAWYLNLENDKRFLCVVLLHFVRYKKITLNLEIIKMTVLITESNAALSSG